MAKKKSKSPSSAPAAASSPPAYTQATGSAAAYDRGAKQREAAPRSEAASGSTTGSALPKEVTKGDWTAILLALMMFFAPAVAVPNEMMLQDTLKSIVVACMTFFAASLFFYQQRQRRDGLRWHFGVGLFAMLAAYALGSMVWAHTFLAGVEAARWIVLTTVVFLTLNTFSRERLPLLAAGVHFGAVAATCFAAAQFWFDWKGIPQGPPPASSFVNRNFYAEFVACTIPFGVFLLLNARRSATVCLLSFTNAFALVGIMMTGTRSAMIASGLALAFIAVAFVLYRKRMGVGSWLFGQRVMALTVFAVTMGLLGSLSSEAKGFERMGINAWERAFFRASLIVTPTEYTSGSASVRKVMWEATARIIQKRPFSGVGAGTWEADIPLYQRPGDALETDYYVHNELLQLLAEYGLVGWAFLLGLLTYLASAAWRTLRAKTDEERSEAPLRAFTLITLLAFLTVSNAGFPWRMASTGARFALAVGALAASDARLGYRSIFSAWRLKWRPELSQVACAASGVALALSIYISYKAYECEYLIVTATKAALGITQSGDPNSPRWDRQRKQLFEDLRRGVAINPHYRKITPMVADEAAKWGDWKNATWIWESVLSSRPYVTAMMANAARGQIQMGQYDKAIEWVQRGRKVQPMLSTLWGAEITALYLKGDQDKAHAMVKEAFNRKIIDIDLLTNGFNVAVKSKDWPLATELFETRANIAPHLAYDSYLRLGSLYVSLAPDPERTAVYYAKAIQALGTPQERLDLLAKLPQAMLPKLRLDLPKLQIPQHIWDQLLLPRAQLAAAPAARGAATPSSNGGFVPQPAR